MNEATSFLLNTYIGERKHRNMEIKYTPLNTQDIYDQLIPLYTNLFKSNIQFFKDSLDLKSISPLLCGSPHLYMAMVYVSHWLIDLYVSNQQAIKNLGLIETPDFYLHYEEHHSLVYDSYLAELNAHIRPTHLKNSLGDFLYVPVLSFEPDFCNEKDPFHVDEFKLNRLIFDGIVSIMEKEGICKMSNLVDNHARGKPSWLLDWHRCGAYSWFPKEGNYCMDDITIAYILGDACTANLGVSDFDEWQNSPKDISAVSRLANQPENYTRVSEQIQYGVCEVRTVEFENWLNCIKMKDSRYRLVDRIYYSNVIFKVDEQARLFAHRMMISPKNALVSSSL